MQRQDPRHAAVTEIAERLLAISEATYEAAPRLVLSESDPSPPPLKWHVAYTSAQLVEVLLRLWAAKVGLEKLEAVTTKDPSEWFGATSTDPKDLGRPVARAQDRRILTYRQLIEKQRVELRRMLDVMNIHIGAEL